VLKTSGCRRINFYTGANDDRRKALQKEIDSHKVWAKKTGSMTMRANIFKNIAARDTCQSKFSEWDAKPDYLALSDGGLVDMRDGAIREEVREDKRSKEIARTRRRDQQKLERAQLRAISRGRGVLTGHRGRGVEVEVTQASAPSQATAEPAIAPKDSLPMRPARASLTAVGSGSASDARTVDLTAEDDTMALPRLDSLEQKLKDLEQQFG